MQAAFMHVPKTAGTTVIAGLINALRPQLVVWGLDRSLFGSFDDFQSVSEESRRYVYLRTHHLPLDADLIAGHFSLTTLRLGYPSAPVLSILREPQARLLSHWAFWRSSAGAPQPAWGTWAEYFKAAYSSFLDFLTDPQIACQTDNVTLRLLLWPHPLIPNNGFISTEHDLSLLEEAERRITTLSHVNIIENPALSNDLTRWCGHPFDLLKIKETIRIPPGYRLRLEDELTPATMDAWRMRSRLDLVLWAAVCRQVMPTADTASLRENVQQRSLRHYGRLLGFQP